MNKKKNPPKSVNSMVNASDVIENAIIDRGIRYWFNKTDITCEVGNSTQLLVKKWPKNTILIAPDSIFNQIDEKRHSNKLNMNVRAFSGATIDDIYYYLYLLIAKEPGHILLHVGTNNCMGNETHVIIRKFLQLKSWIEDILPNCSYFIGTYNVR